MPRTKEPIYTLPHGIQVIGEYPAKGKNRYARLRIRPHPFFPGVPIISNGIYVRKNRVVMASKLGRALNPEEHAHHSDENRDNDSAENLELLSAAEHNRHHKTGSKHRKESKEKTSATLKQAYADGKKVSTLDHFSGEENPNAKLTREKVAKIRASNAARHELATQYGISLRNIGMIKKGVTWK